MKNLPLKIGAGFLLVGLLALIKYALTGIQIPDVFKILASGLLGLGISWFGLKVKQKNDIWGMVATGVGFGVLYGTIWLSSLSYHLIQPSISLAAGVGLSAGIIYLGFMHNSRFFALYAFLGAILGIWLGNGIEKAVSSSAIAIGYSMIVVISGIISYRRNWLWNQIILVGLIMASIFASTFFYDGINHGGFYLATMMFDNYLLSLLFVITATNPILSLTQNNQIEDNRTLATELLAYVTPLLSISILTVGWPISETISLSPAVFFTCGLVALYMLTSFLDNSKNLERLKIQNTLIAGILAEITILHYFNLSEWATIFAFMPPLMIWLGLTKKSLNLQHLGSFILHMFSAMIIFGAMITLAKNTTGTSLFGGQKIGTPFVYLTITAQIYWLVYWFSHRMELEGNKPLYTYGQHKNISIVVLVCAVFFQLIDFGYLLKSISEYFGIIFLIVYTGIFSYLFKNQGYTKKTAEYLSAYPIVIIMSSIVQFLGSKPENKMLYDFLLLTISCGWLHFAKQIATNDTIEKKISPSDYLLVFVTVLCSIIHLLTFLHIRNWEALPIIVTVTAAMTGMLLSDKSIGALTSKPELFRKTLPGWLLFGAIWLDIIFGYSMALRNSFLISTAEIYLATALFVWVYKAKKYWVIDGAIEVGTIIYATYLTMAGFDVSFKDLFSTPVLVVVSGGLIIASQLYKSDKLWKIGIFVTSITGIKLFFSLGSLGEIGSIMAFIVFGALLMGIGYLRPEKENDEHPESLEQPNETQDETDKK